MVLVICWVTDVCRHLRRGWLQVVNGLDQREKQSRGYIQGFLFLSSIFLSLLLNLGEVGGEGIKKGGIME